MFAEPSHDHSCLHTSLLVPPHEYVAEIRCLSATSQTSRKTTWHVLVSKQEPPTELLIEIKFLHGRRTKHTGMDRVHVGLRQHMTTQTQDNQTKVMSFGSAENSKTVINAGQHQRRALKLEIRQTCASTRTSRCLLT